MVQKRILEPREDMTPEELDRINRTFKKALANFKPPESMTVDEWADKYRILPQGTAAEAGQWRTERTPYLREPMKAFTDPKVRRIVMVAASQVGKTEMELNILGYIIDQDPGTTIFVHPSLDDARKFSRLRIAPMIRETKVLKKKVAREVGHEKTANVLQRSFPGGMLIIVGSNSPGALASVPARYVIGDERDRWATSAGSEGDPWKLAQARQRNFYNAKSVEVSTPTTRGRSNIEDSYFLGSQERWHHKCPHCGEYAEITFNRIKFEYETVTIHNKKTYKVKEPLQYVCPICGCLSTEAEMKKQPAKWVAENPDEKAIRSFWLSAFASPWASWGDITTEFLNAEKDPEKLKVVLNTLFGELWEERGDIQNEDTMLARREEYPAELPDRVLCLTCGVDTQDNRLEYEVVGHSIGGGTWGIKKGYIMGKPSEPEVWRRLDDVIDHVYKYKSGRGLKISITFVDSGGHYTQEVYEECRARVNKRVFAIKGKGGEGYPYISPPSKVAIRDSKKIMCYLYTIGVDAGKSAIMSALKVEDPNGETKYCHFPLGIDRGYDENFFNGLLSETMVLEHTKSGDRWRWKKLPGHERNEALDCRNYAMAAFRLIDPDLEAIARRLETPKKEIAPVQRQPRKRKKNLESDEW